MSEAEQKLREALEQRDFEITRVPKHWEDTEEKIASDNRLINFINANYIIKPTHPVDGELSREITNILKEFAKTVEILVRNPEISSGEVIDAETALEQLFAAHLQAAVEEAKQELVYTNKSFCGCPMCEHHSTAYKLTQSNHKSKKEQS